MASNKDTELETPLLGPEEEEQQAGAASSQQTETISRPRLPPPKFGEIITVLSIDGGGIHGLIPTVVLKCLEEKLQAIDGPDARIADYFDVIAGTNTGALIAAMLVKPDANKRPKYTPREIQDFFINNGPKILTFGRWWRWPMDLHKKKMKSVMGEHALGDEPLIFSSFKQGVQKLVEEAKPEPSDVYIGTAAAPTYFPAHYFDIWVSDMEQSKYHLIDGSNNPTMAAISKITKEQLLRSPEFHPNGVDYMKYLVISTGSGSGTGSAVNRKGLYYTTMGCAKWGAFNRIHGKSNSHNDVLADWQVRMLLHNGNCVHKQNYLHIQAQDLLFGEVILPMDKATTKNMPDLMDIGHKLLAEKVAMVDLTTGKYETVEDENGPTNEAELQRFAQLLVTERNLRITQQQQQQQQQQ